MEPAKIFLVAFSFLIADFSLSAQPTGQPGMGQPTGQPGMGMPQRQQVKGNPVARVDAEKNLVIGTQPVYKVAKAKGPITIDGKMDEADWKNAEVQPLSHFYRNDNTPEKQNTKFRMLWDDNNIYLFYECEDTSLTAKETNLDAAPFFDDCAEFLVTPVPDSIYCHFAFEVNITQYPYEFICLWQYYNNRSIFLRGYNPQYKTAVTYNGTINNEKDKDKGWNMEWVIPFNALRDFNNMNRPKAGVRWAFQATRQDRNFVNDRFRTTSTLFPVWDIVKDVHQPSRFGLMEFTE